MEAEARLSLQEAALDELLAALGLEFDVPEDPRVARLAQQQPLYPQYHRIGHKRQLAFRTLNADRRLVREHHEPLLRALVHDDDPSSPRWLTQALLAGVGRRQVVADLVRVVEHGPAYQQGCAVGVWNWVEPAPSEDEQFRAACRRARAVCPDDWARARLDALAGPETGPTHG